MKIRSVHLFKTPLDNSYTNVIDFVNNEARKDTLIRVLSDSYDGKFINGLSRSIKRVGNSTLLVLPISYEEGRQYNYLYIEDTIGRLFFYFITSVTSENDNENSPSCMMTLEWDVWNNNIESFKDVPNEIAIKHYDRFEPNYDEEIFTNSLSPIYRTPSINVNLPVKSEVKYIGNRYIVAYYVITLKEMIKFPINIQDEIEALAPYGKGLTFGCPFTNDDGTRTGWDLVTICDSVNNKYQRNVIYSIAGVFDQREEKFVRFNFTCPSLRDVSVPDGLVTIEGNYNGQVAYDRYGVIELPKLSIPKSIQPYIENISLSFNSPFKYSVDEWRLNINFIDNPIVFWDSFGLVRGEIEEDGWIPYLVVGDIFLHNGRNSHRFENQYMIEEFVVDSKDFLGIYAKINLEKNFNDIDKIEPLSYTPPFTSINLLFNNERINLFPINNKDFYFRIVIYTDTAQPHFNISTSNFDEVVSSATKIFVKNSGYFSFGVDSLMNYLLKNLGGLGSSALSSISQVIGGIGRTALALGGIALAVPTGGASLTTASPAVSKMLEQGTASIGKGTASLLGSATSLALTTYIPDDWSTNSGECDNKYQDRIRLSIDRVDTSNLTYKEFMNSVYMFGYEFSSVASPFENSRLDFDFVQTNGCNLTPLKLNSEDTKTLERIFNRGTTKWHITQMADGSLSFNADMIKDKSTVKNLEIFFETNPDVHNWLNQ